MKKDLFVLENVRWLYDYSFTFLRDVYLCHCLTRGHSGSADLSLG